MADRAKKISELTALTGPAAEDLLVIVDAPSTNAVTKSVTVGTLLTNCSSNVVVKDAYTFTANTVIIKNKQTPTNSSSPFTGGTFFYDENYLYIAIANNTLKRVALSSF